MSDTSSYILLDFKADWCEPCKWAEPVVEKVLQHFNGQIILQPKDIDEDPELAKSYHVMSVPTFILLKDEKEIWRMRGFDQPNKMIEAIQKSLEENS